MKHTISYVGLFALSAFCLTSCDDVFTPAIENQKTLEQMYDDPAYAQGFLVTTYRTIPGCYDNSEYATDDAVTNQQSDAFKTIATGGWEANTWTSLNQWTSAYNSIQFINLFLEQLPNVTWARDPEANALFARRTEGEAYGLRGLLMYYLLRAHGGYDAAGNLLGVAIHTSAEDVNSDFNRGRDSYAACVKQINDDLSRAEQLLPFEYDNIANETAVPQQYADITTDPAVYNRVLGKNCRGLFNGLIARAFKVRTALLAASPAFLNGQDNLWASAAKTAAEILKYKGGIAGLDPKGIEYYGKDYADGLKEGSNPAEILWRENVNSAATSPESDFFPPTLFGSGKMNPSQNLVDAFPMLNGYPISDPNSGYDPANPYAGRDPRLAAYIIYNGSTAGVNNDVIKTFTGEGSTTDGLNKQEYKSTRTGYYMKKRLRMDVNCNPSSSNGQKHYVPRIRYTEMFLDYAEAANEAYGPKADGCGAGFTAYDVIKAIRQRAGITGGDQYLEDCAASQDKFRELIHNERRLEMCFEGQRFWDLRRWNAPLNETVRGISWNADGTYEIIDVEKRDYQDYMRYCPIPRSETLKYSNLQQNRGWK